MPDTSPGLVLQGGTVIEVRSLLRHLEGLFRQANGVSQKAELSLLLQTLNHFHTSLQGGLFLSWAGNSHCTKQHVIEGTNRACSGALLGKNGPAGVRAITGVQLQSCTIGDDCERPQQLLLTA